MPHPAALLSCQDQSVKGAQYVTNYRPYRRTKRRRLTGALENESRITLMTDILQLEVRDLEVQVLTGIYSEETHLPQPLRISVVIDLACPRHFEAATPLAASKNYMDLRRAITTLPEGVHFVLIEAVADHIADTLFANDSRVLRVDVHILKLAIAEAGEGIGIRLVRDRT